MAVVSLYNGLVGNDVGGTWTSGDCAGANTNSISIAANGDINTAGVTPGLYQFSYNVGTGTCADCATVTVDIKAAVSAGTGSTVTACNN